MKNHNNNKFILFLNDECAGIAIASAFCIFVFFIFSYSIVKYSNYFYVESRIKQSIDIASIACVIEYYEHEDERKAQDISLKYYQANSPKADDSAEFSVKKIPTGVSCNVSKKIAKKNFDKDNLLKTEAVIASSNRTAEIFFILDRSSYNKGKIETVQKSIKGLLEKLSDIPDSSKRLAIGGGFFENDKTVTKELMLFSNKQSMDSLLQLINNKQSSNIISPLRKSFEGFKKYNQFDKIKGGTNNQIIFLVTDGNNECPTIPPEDISFFRQYFPEINNIPLKPGCLYSVPGIAKISCKKFKQFNANNVVFTIGYGPLIDKKFLAECATSEAHFFHLLEEEKSAEIYKEIEKKLKRETLLGARLLF